MSTYEIIGILYAIVAFLTNGTLLYEYLDKKTRDIDFLPMSRVWVWLTRLMVGGLFLYSGFVKANDYVGFAYKLEEYFAVFGQHFPPLEGFFNFFIPFAGPMAWFIAVFEIALAIALIVGWRMNLTLWLSMIMMVFFTLLTGYSHFTGAVTDCGCFGDALKITPGESFTKDIILTVMLIPLFLVRKSIKAYPSGRVAWIATAISFLVSGIFSYYCHENLPRIDFRAYKVGVDLNECTTVPAEDGFPKCKNWFVMFSGEEKPEMFKGTKMLVITHDIDKADPKGMEKSVALAHAIKDTTIQFVGLSASGPSAMKPFIESYKIPYVYGGSDQTVLKTIVRSNPGFMLVKEGRILQKWHHNNTPSEEEVLTVLGR